MRKFLGRLIFFFILAGGLWWLLGTSKLSGDFRNTVFRYQGNTLEVITAEPGQSYATVLRFPVQTWIKTASGKGEWRMENLPALTDKYGVGWLTDTVAEVLANGTAINYRDLTLSDRITLYRKVNNENTRVIDTEKLDVWEEKIAPDGEKIIFLSEKWLSYRDKEFLDSQVAAVDAYVRIENASGILGLGSYAALSIDAAGAHVFDVSKSEEILDTCQVLSAAGEKSSLTGWIKKRFGCEAGITNEDKVVILKIGKKWGEKVIDLL